VTLPSLDALVTAGFEPVAAASRLALLERVRAGFEAMTGTAPAWQWLVPGRLEVFGKHTDYAGGRSLVAAVPRGFAVMARPADDQVVRILDVRHGEMTVVDSTGTARPRRGWATYVAAVLQRLSANFPGAVLGADIAFASDLPRAAGVSSSSALLVGVAIALIRRGCLDERAEWRGAITSPEDLAEYLGCIESGRTFRSLAGARGVGTRGGSEDHTAILLSKARTLGQFSYMPVRLEADVEMPSAWRFVVASSGVHADKAGTVRDRYNRSALLASVLVSIWNERAGRSDASLGIAFAGDADGPARLAEWLRQLPRGHVPGVATEELTNRLEHFVREDARVPMALDAFRRADLATLGALAADSQEDAARLLGNQVVETIALVREAIGAGALAASSFGAGFGGSAWAVVAASEAERFGAAWTDSQRVMFPQLSKIEWFSLIPAPPALDVSWRCTPSCMHLVIQKNTV